MKTKVATLWISSPFLFFDASRALAQPYEWYGPGPWHMWGGWGFGWVFPLLMLIAIVFCVAMFFGRGGHRRHGASDSTFSALQILNERFARGEIQKQEYDEKKSALLGGGR